MTETQFREWFLSAMTELLDGSVFYPNLDLILQKLNSQQWCEEFVSRAKEPTK